ncbi:MAG: hypothetical protein KDK50_02555 [Chlamydiia bacterium]|nr:hypothetical protein [Chlamydiia bacterium]
MLRYLQVNQPLAPENPITLAQLLLQGLEAPSPAEEGFSLQDRATHMVISFALYIADHHRQTRSEQLSLFDQEVIAVVLMHDKLASIEQTHAINLLGAQFLHFANSPIPSNSTPSTDSNPSVEYHGNTLILNEFEHSDTSISRRNSIC